MIANGIMIGLHPEQIRDMLTKDTWIVFRGWQDAHAPDDGDAGIMDADQYRKLVEQVDGN
jgi:hypothetical protein